MPCWQAAWLPQHSLCGSAPSKVRGHAEEYGYREGTFLDGPGYLRIAVGKDAARIELVRVPAREGAGSPQVAHAHEVALGPVRTPAAR